MLQWNAARAEGEPRQEPPPTRPAQGVGMEGLQGPIAYSGGTKHPAARARRRDAQSLTVTVHHLGVASLVLCCCADTQSHGLGVTSQGTVAADAVVPGREADQSSFLHSPHPHPPLLSLYFEGCTLLEGGICTFCG